MKTWLNTAGEVLQIECSLPWMTDLIQEACAEQLLPSIDRAVTLLVSVDDNIDQFNVDGWEPLTRGAWRRGSELVVEDVCATGIDMRVMYGGAYPEFTYRWRPQARARAMRLLLSSRFVLLARAVLLQYPALWAASLMGRAPLHACACTAGERTVVLAGPGGVGKSTLLAGELSNGEGATGDNLCVSDGKTIWGLVEPARLEGGSGRRMPHGRREMPLPGRVDQLTPDSIVVLRRGAEERPLLSRCSRETAVRSLVAGTYMAGELRRYWSFAATLSLGTCLGPTHPPIEQVASRLAAGLECIEVQLARTPGARLSQLINTTEVLV